MSPALLLLLTCLLGLGTAMNGRAWQATVTDIVAPQKLNAAVALDSAAFNVARAVGPASGGINPRAYRTGHGVLLNALILYWSAYRALSLEVTPRESILPAERLMGARCAPESVMSDMLHRCMPFSCGRRPSSCSPARSRHCFRWASKPK
jgi:MFS family permease